MIISGHPAARGTVLRRLADDYLESLLTRDPSRAALSKDSRVSLNATLVAPGELPKFDDFPALQIFTDVEQGGIALAGVTIVEGVLRPYALRLKIENERIAEAETIVSGTTKGHFADVDQLMKPDVLYDAPVAPERAATREALRAAADSYWIGLQESDGSIPKFNYRCDRYDNGKRITNNLSILLSPEAAVLTCASSLYGTRPARPLARARAYPVLDVSLGVVVSWVMVDFRENPLLKLPGMTHYMMTLFKVVDGEIRIMDEITEKVPFGTPSAW
jgi:hypothetical protein